MARKFDIDFFATDDLQFESKRQQKINETVGALVSANVTTDNNFFADVVFQRGSYWRGQIRKVICNEQSEMYYENWVGDSPPINYA